MARNREMGASDRMSGNAIRLLGKWQTLRNRTMIFQETHMHETCQICMHVGRHHQDVPLSTPVVPLSTLHRSPCKNIHRAGHEWTTIRERESRRIQNSCRFLLVLPAISDKDLAVSAKLRTRCFTLPYLLYELSETPAWLMRVEIETANPSRGLRRRTMRR